MRPPGFSHNPMYPLKRIWKWLCSLLCRLKDNKKLTSINVCLARYNTTFYEKLTDMLRTNYKNAFYWNIRTTDRVQSINQYLNILIVANDIASGGTFAAVISLYRHTQGKSNWCFFVMFKSCGCLIVINGFFAFIIWNAGDITFGRLYITNFKEM